MKLLIADDEMRIRTVIKEYALAGGYEVVEAGDGYTALDAFKREAPDLLVLDIMMPGMDGFSLLREIRRESQVPVIMLSARGEEYDKLTGFDLGVDDYMVKPFSPRELLARIKAVLSRKMPETDRYEVKGLHIDFLGRSISIDGEDAELTPKETDLLFYMVKNKGIALSRDKLLQNIWGYDFMGEDRTVDAHIKMLRRNLKQYRECIVTLRGMGYKFEDPA